MTGFENIKIESPYKIIIIEDIKINQRPGEHAKLYLTAIIDDSFGFQASIDAKLEDEIHIYENKSGKKTTIFWGITSAVKTSNQNGIYKIELEAISGTFILDIQKKSRSFQQNEMKYSQIIDEITKEYQNINYIVNLDSKEVLNGPIIQYGETDWEFLNRLASHLNAYIICDIMDKNPRFYFGFPNGNRYIVDNNTQYRAGKNLIGFKKAGGYSEGFHDTDFFYYEIESSERYSIGDKIIFKNKELSVSEVSICFEKGILKNRYMLSRPKGIYKNKIYNSKLKGSSIEGKVIDTKGEFVKLHLNIDKNQDKENAHWFAFASPTGNMMYCMPQIGTNASLYFGDNEENNAKVIGCIRKNGNDCAKVQNPNIRYLGTEHGSEMELSPSAINIISGSKEPLKISFDDEFGISIISHKKLVFNADEEVSIYTPKKIKIRANSQLFTKKTLALTGFSIENEYHFLGSNVKANGRDSTSFKPFDDEPKQAEAPKKSPFDRWKLVRNVLAGLAVVAVVVAASVFTLGLLGAAPLVTAVAMGGGIAGTLGVLCRAVSDIRRGEVSDLNKYVSSAFKDSFTGVVSGALFGPFAVAKTLFGNMVFGGTTGIFESCLRQFLEDGRIDPWTVAIDGGIGVITGGLFHGIGTYLSKSINNADHLVTQSSWLKNAAKGIGESLENNINKITKFGNEAGEKYFSGVQKYVIEASENYVQKMKTAVELVEDVFSPQIVTPEGVVLNASEIDDITKSISTPKERTKVQENWDNTYKEYENNLDKPDPKPNDTKKGNEVVSKAGVGKTGEGIPLEEVKPDVLKQIHPDDNGAYGYIPNEGTAYHNPEYDFTDVDWAKDMQNVRKDYLEASKQLEIDIERMTSEGFYKEDIAKHVVDARNQQKVTARANMTAEERAGLEARNIEIYGNPIGPDSQWLFNKTKKKLIKEGTYINDDEIWSSVIKNSMKKDDVINTLLGLIH